MPLFRYRVSNKKIRTQTNVCLVVLSNGVSHWVCPFVCCLLPQTSRQSLATHSSSATFMTTCILVVTFFPATIISVLILGLKQMLPPMRASSSSLAKFFHGPTRCPY
ncbi:hypothetical protein GLYMA_20G001200v4 [Glycine max]|nr:hypothetical protein GLYMA_20G001200v4 [Glycine max]KAH1033859.1 hypothetical protein GYH30_054326 [Glycine max]